MTTALRGIRVLDLSDRSAALAGRVLADLGAEVIMVEPPGGNSIRHLAPRLEGVDPIEGSFAHQYFSANKRSLVLDLEAQGSTFLSLVATADVLIDSERPGYLDDLSLGHETLRAINPGLIQCSVTPFGLQGEWRGRKATDIVAGAAGGLIWLSGESRGTPVQGGADVAYAMAGLIAASAISIALHQRDNTDAAGVHIDVSLQEAAATAAMQTATPSNWTWFNRIPRRPGLSAALRCADGGYVGHMIRPDRFAKFLAWADSEDIDHAMTPDDWELSRLDAPRKDNPVIATTLALAAKLSRDEFFAGALEADLICLPVLSFEDHEQIDQYQINEQFLTVDHGGIDRQLGFVRSPVDGMDEDVVLRAAPLLGADQALADGLSALASTQPATAPAVSPDPARALEGLRVVDFGWVLAAPIGTRLLASFGAEVIRVESAKRPDSMRSQLGPEGVPDADMGGLFNVVNAGKKSLAVDLTTEQGMSLVKELITTADVVVNNFRPGAMERMGLGFDVLTELKPDIVSLNLPGAHRHGPWAVRPSMGNILMAASGFNMLTGFEGERPRGIGIAYPDFTGPHLLTSTILAAVRQRASSGIGQEIHLTQLTGMISLLGAEWMQFKATSVQPPRRANRDPNLCPHGVFPTVGSQHSDDEWVALAVQGQDQWASFCAAVGHPELINDQRFAHHEGRKRNEDVLDEIIAAWTSRRDKWDVADLLQAAGVAAAPVEHLAETYERDPQLQHHYQIVQQPSRPDIDIPINREAAQWVGHELRLMRSPLIGEHNQHVVCEILGHDEEHYVELIIGDVLS
jgi:crotonobetainyl-CoA:carnitine CoA-transferase CaiB-like acyl-CoA transferase